MVLLLELTKSHIVKKYIKELYQSHQNIKKLKIVKYVEFSISAQCKLTQHSCRWPSKAAGALMKLVCDS